MLSTSRRVIVLAHDIVIHDINTGIANIFNRKIVGVCHTENAHTESAAAVFHDLFNGISENFTTHLQLKRPFIFLCVSRSMENYRITITNGFT